MFTKSEKLSVNTSNYSELTERLVRLLVDTSPTGSVRLMTLIEQAKERYKEPVESKLTGWFYVNFRQRGPEVDKAFKDMNNSPDSRLNSFKSLIETGQWNVNSSLNYFIFVELINAIIPGFRLLRTKNCIGVINVLRKPLIMHIDKYLAEYQLSLLTTSQRLAEIVKTVFIVNDYQITVNLAKNEPNNTFFCLFRDKDVWQLLWIDNMGQEYKLDLNQEAKNLLSTKKVQYVAQLDKVYFNSLKNECVKIKDAFLTKIQVLINPSELSNDRLSEQGVCSTFILRGQSGKYELCWVNSIGKAISIDLEQHPQMNEWLAVKGELSQDNMAQLKTYLLHVNIRRPVGMEDFKKELSDKLFNSNLPKVSKSTELKSKPLNLSLFSNIERCLGSRQENKAVKPVEPLVRSGRLDLSKFAAVSDLFSHVAEEKVVQDEHVSCARSV